MTEPRLTNFNREFPVISPEEFATSNGYNDDERLLLYSIFNESITMEEIELAINNLANNLHQGDDHTVTNDMVPDHYTSKPIEQYNFWLQDVKCRSTRLDAFEATAAKYIDRYKEKNGKKDLAKLYWYIWVNRYGNYDDMKRNIFK